MTLSGTEVPPVLDSTKPDTSTEFKAVFRPGLTIPYRPSEFNQESFVESGIDGIISNTSLSSGPCDLSSWWALKKALQLTHISR